MTGRNMGGLKPQSGIIERLRQVFEVIVQQRGAFGLFDKKVDPRAPVVRRDTCRNATQRDIVERDQSFILARGQEHERRLRAIMPELRGRLASNADRRRN